jgi:hypothetical protein
MPRYVVLEHETPAGYARPRHWDLMLETGGALRTWALDEPPERVRSGQGEHSVQGELLRDHRLAYLDYEGPVSGGRGTVRRWDAGECEWLAESDGEIQFALVGDRVGSVSVRAQRCADDQRWLFTFAPV